MLLLASNSPRRRELLSLGNWMFSVSVSNVDESQRTGEAPADYVLRLAEAKARAAIPNARPEHVVIGADTTVVDGNRILGKPKDMMEASRHAQVVTRTCPSGLHSFSGFADVR